VQAAAVDATSAQLHLVLLTLQGAQRCSPVHLLPILHAGKQNKGIS
jgi:hypothetical protein